MKKIYSRCSAGLLGCTLAVPCFAGITFGDVNDKTGELSISGYVRAKYQDKNYGSDNDHKIQFDAAKINLDYDSANIFGHVEYRCYQYDTLCDFSTLVDGYLGYRFSPKQNLTIGIQPVPFGVARFWESTLYGGINNTMGLEDAHNLGVNYHHEIASTKIDMAYFATDGGHYVGDSLDSARYTANFVKSSDPTKSTLSEKNMWIARVSQDLKFIAAPDLKINVGGSYWYSDIENKSAGLTGSRQAWALFSSVGYDNLAFTLTGGKNSVNNKDLNNQDYSVMGSYDGEYDVANKGYFYTADVRYVLKDVYKDGLNITPYLTYSSYIKDVSGAKDSSRNFIGASFDYKKVSLVAEYIFAKNDPFIGGSSSALAQGDNNKTNRLLNLTLFYYF
ncbi:hypothetical protein [Acinetobacter qingfengensis]|uniref:Porin n=1 Tax=Acinetobacter qingfengensis TaxID=1262585 RepID=A0A1E7RD86_9GAMM|nr:hypothetical protein [Acinetobacter qingfengensis]OEY97301.1 hypothetical protein BJI46_10470 [Acinetobacter qingfengensis]